jgi:hypothetical protein
MSSNTIIGTVQKKTETSQLGIYFCQRDQHIEIKMVRGKFEKKTDLVVPGLKVLQVNGTPVETETVEAIHHVP